MNKPQKAKHGDLVEQERPNILLIGCYGNTLVRTPHIDALEELANAGFDETIRDWRATTHPHPGQHFGPFVREIRHSAAGTLDVPMDQFPDVMAADMTMEFLAQRDTARPCWATCAFPGPHSPMSGNTTGSFCCRKPNGRRTGRSPWRRPAGDSRSSWKRGHGSARSLAERNQTHEQRLHTNA